MAAVYKVGLPTTNGSDAQVKEKQSSTLKLYLLWPSWKDYENCFN